MPYRFLENEATADIAIEVLGANLDSLFHDAGEALIRVMIDNPNAIKLRESREFTLNNNQLDLLLYNFLEQFIYYKDKDSVLLRPVSVALLNSDKGWQLYSLLQGESIDPVRHHLIVDVKAVTLHQFSLAKTDGQWRAHIILDI